MRYKVVVESTAEQGIREAIRWLSRRASPTVVAKWSHGLIGKVDTLKTQPDRCPLAAESEKFPEEIRELLYGRRKSGRYRILFTIAEDTVHILYVRHTARDELEP